MIYRKGRQILWSRGFIDKLVKIMEFHCKATGKDNPYQTVIDNYKKLAEGKLELRFMEDGKGE